MPRHCDRRPSSRLLLAVSLTAFLGACSPPVTAQEPATSSPAITPAGVLAARPEPTAPKAPALISQRQAREADDAYLDGARQMERNDVVAAEKSFARAVQLNPSKQEYVLSLAVAHEHRLTQLIQSAAKARLLGDIPAAESFLAEARKLDPENPIVAQHRLPDPPPPAFIDPLSLRANTPSFAGPIELDITPGKKDIHQTTGVQDVIRAVYKLYGIDVTFDSSVTDNKQLSFDLTNVDFTQATHFLHQLTHTFAVAVQPHSALIAKDTADNRERLNTLIEETIYLPGVSSDTMTEMANVARNIFDLKQVTASPTGGDILVRGDEKTLKLLNATYADMLNGGSDVLLELRVYEIDKSHLVNIGSQLPSGAGVYPVASELQNIINSNQSVITAAIQTGVLKLTGNSAVDIPAELAVLAAAGDLNISQITGLLGTFGQYGALPLAGLYLIGSSTFNLLLNSSDVRTLDALQVRSSDNQPATLRFGTRYPIVTSTYSSGVSSSLASSLANTTVNGVSVSSLLASATATVPQIQYEDLGITLKATPRIQRSGDIALNLDLKIEAIGSGSLNGIPVLNNRTFTSTIAVPAGQTALLASTLTQNEMRDVDGIPGLSELPGFQGTEKSKQVDSGELLITITPHIVRSRNLQIVSRRLAIDHVATGSQ